MIKSKSLRIIFIASVMVIILIVFTFMAEFAPERQVSLKIALFCDGIWQNTGVDNITITNTLIGNFEKTHPNIQLSCNVGVRERDYSEWLSQKVIKSDIPDIVTILPDDFSTLIKVGVLRNLDEFIKSDSTFDQNAIYSNALLTGQYNDSYYALPRELDPTLMFVNKTLLKKNNISIPSNEWTWDEFYNICSQLTKDTDGDGIVDQFGSIDFTWQTAASTNGASPFEKNGEYASFNTPEMGDAITLVADLKKLNKGVTPKEEDFINGKVAFKPFQYSWYRKFKASPFAMLNYYNFDWECIKLPKGPNGKNAGEINTFLLGISASTKHPEECWEFLKYVVTSEEAQKIILENSEGVSVLKSVNQLDTETSGSSLLKDDTPLIDKDVLEGVIEDSQLQPRFFLYNDCIDFADKELYRIIDEGGNIQEQLVNLNKEINTMLQ